VFPRSARPTFEVASIKPNTSGTTGSRSSSRGNGHFQGTNLTVKSLIFQAYRVQDFQLVGGPDWINTERFDVEARAAEGTMPPPELPGQFDYTLTWSGSTSPIPALPPAGGDAPTAAEPAGPSFLQQFRNSSVCVWNRLAGLSKSL